MLFKNLPLRNLFIIISIRLVLDGIASLTFLNKKERYKTFDCSNWASLFTFILRFLNLLEKKKISQKIYISRKNKLFYIIKNKSHENKEFLRFITITNQNLFNSYCF